jgi:hypothetical protein
LSYGGSYEADEIFNGGKDVGDYGGITDCGDDSQRAGEQEERAGSSEISATRRRIAWHTAKRGQDIGSRTRHTEYGEHNAWGEWSDHDPRGEWFVNDEGRERQGHQL